MKKSISRILMLLAFVGICVNASAQNGEDYPRFHAGIRAGVYTSTWGSDTKALAFPAGGFAFDFRVAPFPLYLETGLYYQNMGLKVDAHDENIKEDNHAVMMPLALSYHFYVTDEMAIQPLVGMYGAYCTEKKVFEGFDYGVRLGVGFNWRRLYTNIGYNIGLGNADKDGNELDLKKNKHGGFFFNIGFNMGGDH